MKRIFLFLLGGLFFAGSHAQQNMTLYQMHDILQSNSLNPSVASDCRWNVGFPLLGSISAAGSTPVTYKKLGIDNGSINVDDVLPSLKKTNLLSANANINILAIGYRAENTYFQFTVNERFSAALAVSKDLMDVALNGNSSYLGQTIEGKIGLSTLYYREYGINVAHDFGDDTWFGGRVKLLFGRFGIHSPDNKISLYSDPGTSSLDLSSDLLLRASIPGYAIFNGSGLVDDFKTELESSDFIFNPSNVGVALDLGINKTFDDGWKVSASVLNIGLVSWTKNTHVLSQQSTFSYNGPTLGANDWGDFADTLKSALNLNYKIDEPFSQWLSPAVMFGVNYPVADYVRVGVTGYGEFNPVGMPWALSATALTDNISNFYGAVSYTVTNNSFVNIGVGLGAKLGPFNIHAITDNVLALVDYSSQKYGTLQFGINFKFGCGDSGGSGKRRIRSVPCPSYGGYGSMKSIPCSSSKRR